MFFWVFLPLLFTRRSPNIRPGQFGYGKVPFSLPLHRPNRQARHTVNSTDGGLTDNNMENVRKDEEQRQSDEEDREAWRTEEEGDDLENSEAPGAEEGPTTTTTTGSPHRHVDRPSHTPTEHVRSRVPSRYPFSRSSSPSVFTNRQRFDWNSVTAPPPPVPSLSRQRSSGSSPPFSSPLHRPSPAHRDRDVHPGFTPQTSSPGNIYPLQHPHMSHLGLESGRQGRGEAPQVFRCSGPEKEYRRCFSQVGLCNNRILKASCLLPSSPIQISICPLLTSA